MQYSRACKYAIELALASVFHEKGYAPLHADDNAHE